MKICITSEGESLDSRIDARFGRCRYFLVCDVEKNTVEAIENSNSQLSGGAGIQAAQLMVSKGVETVLTGNVGPNAFKVLAAAGIKIITGICGTVPEILDDFKRIDLAPAQKPSVPSKFGSQESH